MKIEQITGGEVALNLADELYKETGDVYYKFTKGDIYTKLGRIKFRTGANYIKFK